MDKRSFNPRRKPSRPMGRLGYQKIAVVLLSLLLCGLFMTQSAWAIVSETPGNTFETAKQLGLTGTDTNGKSGIQLAPKNDYYFWVTFDKTSDVTFTFFTRMQVNATTIVLRLFKIDKKAYGERTGKAKCAGGSCKATLTITGVPAGSYYLRVSYKGVSGASSNGFLTWRAASLTGPLPWEKSNIAFGQMDSTTREGWYRFKFPKPVAGKDHSLTITARANYTVNIYTNDNLKMPVAKTSVTEAGKTSPPAVFQTPTNRSADVFYIVQVVNSQGKNSEYTLVLK